MRWFNWIASAIKKPLNKFFLSHNSPKNMNDIEKVKKLIIDNPLKLDCVQTISNFPLAY